LRGAVFFDKDGVLNVDHGVDGILRQPELYPDAGAAVDAARRLGFAVVVVTNQPCVARGLVSEETLALRLESLRTALLALHPGAIIDRLIYCPHHPHADVERYRVRCACRKPAPGMLLEAARALGLDLARCFMVGDRRSDVAAGHAAGCTTVLVRSGRHLAAPIVSDIEIDPDLTPDFTIDALSQLEEILRG